MKKIISGMAIAVVFIFVQKVEAQSCVENLRNHCIVYSDAEIIFMNADSLNTHRIKISEYKKDEDGEIFSTEIAMIDQKGQSYLLDKISNDIWLLISSQLNGEAGKLSTTMVNLFPTKTNDNQSILIVVCWKADNQKWLLTSLSLPRVKMVKKGVRIFTQKS